MLTHFGSCQYDVAYEAYRSILNDLKVTCLDQAVYPYGTVKYDGISSMPSIFDTEAMIKAMREASWDLWTAMDNVGRAVFVNLDVDAKPAPGFGPEMNKKAQSANYRTAIIAALLVHTGLVVDETVFGRFDT